MINTCLSILDRIIGVIGIQIKRRNRLFSELWEPTFSELLLVHRDYIEMFEEVKTMLFKLEAEKLDEKSEEHANKIDEIIEYLRHKRTEFEPVRSKLIALIDAMSVSNLDDESRAFVKSFVGYFPIGTIQPRYSKTDARRAIFLFEAYREQLSDLEREFKGEKKD